VQERAGYSRVQSDGFARLLTLNLLEERRDVVVVKGELAAEEHIHNDPGAPHVDLRAGIQPGVSEAHQKSTHFPEMTSGAA
jgi:hypothetical protein